MEKSSFLLFSCYVFTPQKVLAQIRLSFLEKLMDFNLLKAVCASASTKAVFYASW